MHRCIRLWRTAGNRPQMWTAVRNLAEILHGLGLYVEALTLNCAVDSDADRAPELTGPYGDHHRNILTAVRSALSEAQATDAQAHGAGMTYAEAANFALEAVAKAQADQAKS